MTCCVKETSCVAVVKEPPYEVCESGYAGFLLAIDVHFKSRSEPRKVRFNYDLFLSLQEKTQQQRYEKLTFQNPEAVFCDKLLASGGVSGTIFFCFVLWTVLVHCHTFFSRASCQKQLVRTVRLGRPSSNSTERQIRSYVSVTHVNVDLNHNDFQEPFMVVVSEPLRICLWANKPKNY